MIEKEIDLKELIVKTLQSYGGEPRTVRHIERLINLEYGDSLNYSHNAFLTALQHLVHDGLHVDNVLYSLNIKIFPRFLKRYEVKFLLLGVRDEDNAEGFNPPPGIQPLKEWSDPAGTT